jgi:peptidoglycan/xylan/chitin deacetylase (PgdA/CDA1 family)
MPAPSLEDFMIELGLGVGPAAARRRSLSPWQAPPAPFAATTVYDFAGGLGGWTRSSAAGVVALDTAVADAGRAQSLKLVTETAAQTADAHVAGLSPRKDLAGRIVRVRLRADRLARLGYARLAFLNAGNGNYSAVDLLTNDSGLADDGEWLTVEIAKGDLSEPAIDMGAIERIMLRESALAAASPVQVNVQSLGLRAEPAAGCLVLAFDDGWKGQYANAFPAMAAAGLRGCVYAICDQHGESGGALYMNRGELRALQAAGWDVGCHADTVAHHNDPNGFAALTPAAFEAACVAMKEWHVANGFGSDHFAWPRGRHTQALRAVAARYFSSQRTFRTSLNRFEADIYPFADTTRLRQCAVTGGGTPSAVATVTGLIDACMAAKKTLILTFHDIGNGGAGTEYPVAGFAAIVGHIAAKGYPVRTLTEIFARGV